MAFIKIPIIKSKVRASAFTTTVEIPVVKLTAENMNGKSILEVEKIFDGIIKSTKDPSLQKDCNKCIEVLRLASNYKALLKEVLTVLNETNGKMLKFTFSFNELKNLVDFVNDLEKDVK